jgi:hypothetical protein
MIKTRREFVALAAGATTWPCVANAQQTDRTRSVGVQAPPMAA